MVKLGEALFLLAYKVMVLFLSPHHLKSPVSASDFQTQQA